MVVAIKESVSEAQKWNAENAKMARQLGIKQVFNLDYRNHDMDDVSKVEMRARLIFLIRLLKIDTEGSELKVLLGAAKTLQAQRIDMIQIEFNEMNVVSRVFFRDYFQLLREFDIYRLLPGELLPLRDYRPLYCELFAFQNLLAVRKGLPDIA